MLPDVRTGVNSQTGSTTGSAAGSRIDSVDIARGLVMVLMALDHVRDFVGDRAISPTDVAHASTALFLTRWITHLCAPTFFLLAGVGAYLSRRRHQGTSLARFLALRGTWLLVLEVVVLRCLAWQFNIDFHLTMLTILWALGWSMIALAPLALLPVRLVGAIGLAIVVLHNLLDPVRSASPIWTVLHAPNVLFHSNGHIVFVAYPVLPWIGVMALGYGVGPIFERAYDTRQRALLTAGVAGIAGFIVLRWINGYGDPDPWRTFGEPVKALLSFLNTTKYPPSLLYLLMTLGPLCIALAWFERWRTPALHWLVPLGRVPLFYFALHAVAIHLVAIAICAVQYGDIHWMFRSDTIDAYPVTAPPGWGVSLPAVYGIWIGVVVSLYPLCVWYARIKARRRDGWLRFL